MVNGNILVFLNSSDSSIFSLFNSVGLLCESLVDVFAILSWLGWGLRSRDSHRQVVRDLFINASVVVVRLDAIELSDFQKIGRLITYALGTIPSRLVIGASRGILRGIVDIILLRINGNFRNLLIPAKYRVVPHYLVIDHF